MWKTFEKTGYFPFFQKFSTAFSEPWMQCTDNFLCPPEIVDISVRGHRDPQKSFLIFSVFHKRSELFFLRGCTDRFGLVYRQPFHQPAEFLTGEEPCLRSIAWPLEPSVPIQTFLVKDESILILSEYSDKISYPQTFVIRTIVLFM